MFLQACIYNVYRPVCVLRAPIYISYLRFKELNMRITALREILASGTPLLISGSGHQRYMMEAFPDVTGHQKTVHDPNPKSYTEITTDAIKDIINQ